MSRIAEAADAARSRHADSATVEWAESFLRGVGEKADQKFAGSNALELARRALFDGGTVIKPGEVEWDIAGDCQSPMVVFKHEVARDRWAELRETFNAKRVANEMLKACEKAGLKTDNDSVVIRAKPRKLGLKITVSARCRKCVPCLMVRRNMWAYRAVAECEGSQRTWFGTLTLRTTAHEHFKRVAQVAGDTSAYTWEERSDDERFLARHRAITPQLTKWLKRVRKNTGAQLRYLLVCEAHESGLPHYHCLVHEVPGSCAVRYRDLEAAWPFGFSDWKLVTDKRQAIYLCKYIGKSALARVRASVQYGTALSQSAVSVINNLPTVSQWSDFDGPSEGNA
jgi:hypothetical protein